MWVRIPAACVPGDLPRHVDEGPHQGDAPALLEADRVFFDGQIRTLDRKAANVIVDEFALENDAEPEARRNRLPDSFAGLHFEQRPRPDARFGEPGYEDFARDRTTLANDEFATGDIADRMEPRSARGWSRRTKQTMRSTRKRTC